MFEPVIEHRVKMDSQFVEQIAHDFGMIFQFFWGKLKNNNT